MLCSLINVLIIWVGVVLAIILVVWLSSYLWLSFEVFLNCMNQDYFSFAIIVDYVSILCDFMLLCCGIIVLFYTKHYFSGDEDETRSLNSLIIFFVVVMFILVNCGNLFFTLVMWEYLGVVSFFLILYYSNSASSQASLVTMFSSRFGDVAMFFLLIYCMCFGSFSMSMFIMILIVFIIITKSATFPFTSWLLEAMRAPTPVSSLVHSSTLVAAGVWFLNRYIVYLENDGSVAYVSLVVLCFVTITITCICSYFFLDVKKIVALSTCNNVSWCLVYCFVGDSLLSLLQLVSHGISKCLLFIIVGDYIVQNGGTQNSGSFYLSRYGSVSTAGMASILILFLCGLPFLGVFFTKHVMIGCQSFGNIVVIVWLTINVLLSFFYSARFLRIFLVVSNSGVLGISAHSFIKMVSFLFVGSLSVNFIFVSVYMNSSLLSIGLYGFVFVVVQLGVFVLSWFLVDYLKISGFWVSVLFGCDSLVGLFRSSWNLLKVVYNLGIFRWEVMLLESLSYKWSEAILNDKWLYNIVIVLLLFVLLLLLLCNLLYLIWNQSDCMVIAKFTFMLFNRLAVFSLGNIGLVGIFSLLGLLGLAFFWFRWPLVFSFWFFVLLLLSIIHPLFLSLLFNRLAGGFNLFVSSLIPVGTPLWIAWFVSIAEGVSYVFRPIVLVIRPFVNLSIGVFGMVFLGLLVQKVGFIIWFLFLGLFFYEIFVSMVHWFIVWSILDFSVDH